MQKVPYVNGKVPIKRENPARSCFCMHILTLSISTCSQIQPGGSVQYTETITPQSPGRKVLIGLLDCAALRQVINQLEIIVQ